LTDIAASLEAWPARATAANNEGVKKYHILDPPSLPDERLREPKTDNLSGCLWKEKVV
jgi:hypothetical protein